MIQIIIKQRITFTENMAIEHQLTSCCRKFLDSFRMYAKYGAFAGDSKPIIADCIRKSDRNTSGSSWYSKYVLTLWSNYEVDIQWNLTTQNRKISWSRWSDLIVAFFTLGTVENSHYLKWIETLLGSRTMLSAWIQYSLDSCRGASVHIYQWAMSRDTTSRRLNSFGN